MSYDKEVWTYEPTTVVKNVQAAYVQDLPEHQKSKIEELRKRTEDVLQPKHDNFFLIKWLRARKWDVGAAENMLRAHLKWRLEWRVDHLYEEFQPSEVILKYVTQGLCGEDREGCPLYVFPIGNYDGIGMMSSADSKDQMKFYIYNFEYCLKLQLMQTEKHGKVVSNLVAVVDIDNFQFKDWIYKPVFDLLIQFAKMFEANYPEVLKVIVVVNASRIFRIFYTMVKPFLCEDTRKKFCFYGKDGSWKAKLLELVEPSQLPVHWGGDQVDAIDQNPYCSSKIMMGGKIPQSYYKCNNRGTFTDNDLHTVTILKRDTFSLDVDVPQGSTLSWSFWTEEHDIAFGVNRGTICEMPIQRYNCPHQPVKDEMKCEEAGKYSLVFDNSYSRFRAKKVSYEVQVLSGDTEQSFREDTLAE